VSVSFFNTKEEHNMDRRKFIQTTAGGIAAGTAGMYGSSALAADDIKVGSIHDLSGGLDIYGKPMVDALTLAVEEQNAAGGLLGKKSGFDQL